MAIWKCNTCANLHGARVEVCGMCGSTSITQIDETPKTIPPAPPGFEPEHAQELARGLVERIGDKLDEVGDELVDCLQAVAACARAATAWLRQNTDTKRDPETRPGSSPTVDGPKK